MNNVGQTVSGILAAIVSLAVLAIVISSRANTVNVVSAFMGGITNLIGVAISPITGASVSNLNGGGLAGGQWQTGQSYSNGATSGFASSSAAAGNIGGVFNVGGQTFGGSIGLGSITSLFGSGSGSNSGSGLSSLFGSSGSANDAFTAATGGSFDTF